LFGIPVGTKSAGLAAGTTVVIAGAPVGRRATVVKHPAVRIQRRDLRDIRFSPLNVPVERRNLSAREALVHRIRAEFYDMRGLSLTLPQAARLFGLPCEASARILAGCQEEGLLRLTANGRYVLRSYRF
jgi:hypothetical protein